MMFLKKGFEVMSGLVGSKCLCSIFFPWLLDECFARLGGYGSRKPVGEFVADVFCGLSRCGVDGGLRRDDGAPEALDPFSFHVSAGSMHLVGPSTMLSIVWFVHNIVLKLVG